MINTIFSYRKANKGVAKYTQTIILVFATSLFINYSSIGQTNDKTVQIGDHKLVFSYQNTGNTSIKFTICDSTKTTCKESNTLSLPIERTNFINEFYRVTKEYNAEIIADASYVNATIACYEQLPPTLKKENKSTSSASSLVSIGALPDLSESSDKSIAIGYFTLLRNKNKQATSGNSNITSNPATAEILIEDAVINPNGIRVKLEDGQEFFNKYAISLLRIHENRSTILVNKYSDKRQYGNIYLNDVIEFSQIGKFGYPSDQSLHLNAKEDKITDTVYLGVSLNSYLDVSVYSDLLGLLANKPNGLIQTELSGNIISNTRHIGHSGFVLHSFVKPYVRLSKFDSKYASLNEENIETLSSGKDSVDRAYLNQISYLQAGVKVNLIKTRIGINQIAGITFGADINLVKTDSLQKKQPAKYNSDIVLFNYYPELFYTIKRYSNFGMECSFRLLFQRISDRNEIISNRETNYIFDPQITIFYYPFEKINNRIYFRFSYFDNLSESRGNFTQFQFGYKSSLTFSKKE